MRASLVLAAAISLLLLGPAPDTSAAIEPCQSGAQADNASFLLSLTCPRDGASGTIDQAPTDDASDGGSLAQILWEHRWAASCGPSSHATDPRGGDACGLARACPSGSGILAEHWARRLRLEAGTYITAGGWNNLGTECITFDPDDPPPDVVTPPQITWQMVLNEIKRVGLPALAIRVQPEGRTLVNFETIFYAEPEPFERRLSLLGQRVDVRATATSFAWSFGDGETLETATAGEPYPAKDIVHEYADADVTVAPRVDVTYTAQFRVNGGSWQEIPETVTIGGPPTSLDVLEATPVLVGPG